MPSKPAGFWILLYPVDDIDETDYDPQDRGRVGDEPRDCPGEESITDNGGSAGSGCTGHDRRSSATSKQGTSTPYRIAARRTRQFGTVRAMCDSWMSGRGRQRGNRQVSHLAVLPKVKP
jgi:hypothetical protein